MKGQLYKQDVSAAKLGVVVRGVELNGRNDNEKNACMHNMMEEILGKMELERGVIHNVIDSHQERPRLRIAL